MPANVMSVHGLREWAQKCDTSANHPRISGDERARLLKMKRALLDLAQEQEWLEGKTGETSNDRKAASCG
jgi:hypothetical protein